MIKASLTLVTSLLLTLTVAVPAHADPVPFEENAKKGVAVAASGFVFAGIEKRVAGSLVAPEQNITVERAIFKRGAKELTVVRTVGAVPEESMWGSEAVASIQPGAKKKNPRRVMVSNTADEYGPGLTLVTWAERSGVNYQIVSQQALPDSELVKVAAAVPADPTVAPAEAVQALETSSTESSVVSPLGAGNLYVDGWDSVKDDWQNEGKLCQGCAWSQGNYVGMWQQVLWADGKLDGINCNFGSGTRAGTINWQNWRGLTADGVVGTSTLGNADNRLIYYGDLVVYDGSIRDIDFHRPSDGRYRQYQWGPEYTYDFSGGRNWYC